MGLFLRGADTIYALRFLRLLTMPWEKTAAFKVGVVDENGKRLKKPETSEEKAGYTIFHRLVFNIRRMMAKIPLGKSTIARYLAAFWLIKEKTDLTDTDIAKILQEAYDIDPTKLDLTESYLLVDDCGYLPEGTYQLKHDIALPKTGQILALKNTLIEVHRPQPVGSIFDVSIFEVTHRNTLQKIYVTEGDVKEMTSVSSIATKPMPFRSEFDMDSDEQSTTIQRQTNGKRNKHSSDGTRTVRKK